MFQYFFTFVLQDGREFRLDVVLKQINFKPQT
jgi:hypothetical protein